MSVVFTKPIGKKYVFEVRSVPPNSFSFTLNSVNGENLAKQTGFKYEETFGGDHFFVDESLPRAERRKLTNMLHRLSEGYLKKLKVKKIRITTNKTLGWFLVKHLGYKLVSESNIGMDIEVDVQRKTVRAKVRTKIRPRKPVSKRRITPKIRRR